MMDKSALRAQMRAIRRGLSMTEQEAASQAVCSAVMALEPYRDAACVMAYMACRGELSLVPVIREILQSGRVLALPRCESPGVMTARRVTDMAQLVPGAYGLLEPDVSCEVILPQEIDLMLVPGTAFDREGHRLGQGGGYYDRFLCQTRALRVGVCYSGALLGCVPHEAHDIRMDAVVTPDGIVWADKYGRK